MRLTLDDPDKAETGQTIKLFKPIISGKNIILKPGFSPKKSPVNIKVNVAMKDIKTFRKNMKEEFKEAAAGPSVNSEFIKLKSFSESKEYQDDIHGKIINIGQIKSGLYGDFKTIKVKDCNGLEGLIFASKSKISSFDHFEQGQIIKMNNREIKSYSGTMKLELNFKSDISGIDSDNSHITEQFQQVSLGKYVHIGDFAGYDELYLYKSCSNCHRKIDGECDKAICLKKKPEIFVQKDFRVKMFIEKNDILVQILAFSKYFW